MTPSKKEVDEKNREIVGDATSSKEENKGSDEKSEEENTTTVPPKQTEVEKVVSKIVKTDSAPTEAVEEKKSEIKVTEQKKNKDEKKEGEKKHKKKADKTTPKIEIPTADKHQKQGLNKDHSEDYSKFSDELMKSDIIDSEESSESSSSEEMKKTMKRVRKKVKKRRRTIMDTTKSLKVALFTLVLSKLWLWLPLVQL
uniref:Uncharacterized protein n=1 Tax=Ditylenchus dipsaci TaxID=166011 RepID=A0A915D1N5_9BILA